MTDFEGHCEFQSESVQIIWPLRCRQRPMKPKVGKVKGYTYVRMSSYKGHIKYLKVLAHSNHGIVQSCTLLLKITKEF